MTNQGIRLNKFLAQQLNMGRRAADDLITSGKVLLNGQKPMLGARVQPNDRVEANGKTLGTDHETQKLYVLLNKPTGYVCSRRSQGGVPTIYELLPAQFQHLKSVGRLDKDSSGLLLLTNDGDLAHRMTHPSFKKIKKYEVTVTPGLAPLHRQMINDIGVQLPDGASQLTLERLQDGDDTQWLITMHEGRNRQIRRTFEALGYAVTRLHRIQFGTLALHDLTNLQLKQIDKPHL